nr:transposase, mutator type [Tanacetum cinerariifolium]
MLCEWRIRKKGSKADPYNDLDNGLKKISSDHDVLQMLKYVKKYKVIDLYVDHSVTKETVNVDESLLVNELDNDLFIGNEMLGDNDEDVIEDVSEDEWLQNSLRLVAIVTMEEEEFEEEGVNHDKLDSGSDSEYEGERKKALKMYHKMKKANVSNTESGGTTRKENFYVGLKIDSGSDSEYEGERKKALKMYHKMKKANVSNTESSGKVPQFGCKDEDDDSGSKGVVSSGSKGRASPKKKGIIPAIAESFPSAEHRFCLKHIYDNMKLSWRGQLYKEMLWRCATSTSVQRFDKHMEKLKDFNKDAYEWLKKIPPQHWYRSNFFGRAHYDVFLNNICEVFNRQLVNGRDKPIITCLEFIKETPMKRIINVQKVISKSDGPFTPNANKVFNIIVKEAGQIKVFRAKKMAQERVEGNHKRQYAQLRDYCLELKNNNPNTTIKIKVEPPDDINSTERKFKRVYVCLGPLKDGFKAVKMDLLGLDGCFLSGSYPGWILTA